MIEITAKARKFVADYFKDKEKVPIRLFVKLGGCGIRSLGVALEKRKSTDKAFDIDGFEYIVNKKVLERVQPIKVDSDGVGFRLTGTGVHAPSGCGTCGYMCGVTGSNRCAGDCATCEHQCAQSRVVNR